MNKTVIKVNVQTKILLFIMIIFTSVTSISVSYAAGASSDLEIYQGIFMKGNTFLSIPLSTSGEPGESVGVVYNIRRPESKYDIFNNIISTVGYVYVESYKTYYIEGNGLKADIIYRNGGITIQNIYGAEEYSGDYTQVSNAGANMSPDMIWLNIPQPNAIDGDDLGRIEVFSDHSNMCALVGETITVNSALYLGDDRAIDADEMNVTIDDSSIASMSNKTEKDGYTHFYLLAKKSGTTFITISSKYAASAKRFALTVNAREKNAYTIYNIPELNIDRDYITNFYNLNGIYIDNYDKSVKNNGSAVISFDAYNLNYINGIVEIHYKDGQLKDAALIKKASSNGGNFKGAVIDNTINLCSDFRTGEMFTYRQRSGNSGKCPIKVEIPKGGYAVITNDPMKSPLIGLINAFDTGMTIYSAYEDTMQWKAQWTNMVSQKVCEKITKNIIEDSISMKMMEESVDLSENLYKNFASKAFPTASTAKEYLTSLSNIFTPEVLEEAFYDTLIDAGVNVGVDVFEQLSGPAGPALEAIFAISNITDAAQQLSNYTDSFNTGSVSIQVPADNSMSNEGVTVEMEDVDNSTAVDSNSYRDEDLEKYGNIWDRLKDVKYKDVKNITLVKNGKESQPKGEVTVTIQLNDTLKNKNNIHVYRCEEDGTFIDMHASKIGNTVVFKTNHFSLYAIIDGEIAGAMNDLYNNDNTPSKNEPEYIPEKNIGSLFSDIANLTSRQKSAIEYAVENNIVHGYEDKTFKPYSSITRAEFATMMCSYFGFDTNRKSEFDDSREHWASRNIRACTDRGAIHGVGDNKFNPDGTITFEQAVKIFTILKGYTDGVDVDSLGGYPDGYIKIGKQLNLFRDMTVTTVGREIPRIDIVMMIYNASGITAESVASLSDNNSDAGTLDSLPSGSQNKYNENLQYEVRDDGIWITDCDTDAEGQIVIPNHIAGKAVVGIQGGAFQFCNYVTGVSIPEGITELQFRTFMGSKNIVNVSLPSTLKKIGQDAFYGCEGLGSIDIPDSVTEIGDFAFCECISLRNVKIHYGIERLNRFVFGGCKNLQTIEIPKTVKTISDNAFSECNNLTDVYFGGTQAEWNSIKIYRGGGGNDVLEQATIHTNDVTFN